MDETQPSKYRPLSDSFRGLADRLPSFPTTSGGRNAEDKETLVLNDMVAAHHHHQHSPPELGQLQQQPLHRAFDPIEECEHVGQQFYCGHHAHHFENQGMTPEMVEHNCPNYSFMQQNLDNQSRDWSYNGPTNATACYYNPLTSAVSIRYEQPPIASRPSQRGSRAYSSVKERMEAKKKAKRAACYYRTLTVITVILILIVLALGLFVFVYRPMIMAKNVDGAGMIVIICLDC